MKISETPEKTRRREKRFNRRENYNSMSQKRKERREEDLQYGKQTFAAALDALKRDSRKNRPDGKRPGQEKFLPAFSFIPSTPYDKRHLILPGYRCRSFNEHRQYIDFFREFIYPHKVPHVLIWTGFEQETLKDDQGRDTPSPDVEIIRNAKKWICDIVSGRSFFKQNRNYFTRAEAHFFLNTDIAYGGPDSVIELCFYAKCMARKMGVKWSRFIAKTFVKKFVKHWNHPMVTGFLDLISRNLDYNIENSGLGDICDFVLDKIMEHRKARGRCPLFSFSGRTMTSVVALANEWHANILREQEIRNDLERAEQRTHWQAKAAEHIDMSRWKGIYVSHSQIGGDACVWSFTQLCSARELLNEGRLMKNCVSSYSYKCAAGDSAIFHVSRIFTAGRIIENIATLEVSKNRVLEQAKAKYNTKIASATINVIRKWALFNRIKIDESSL
jgi:hypothetical protein